jgi:hypothetical protein
MGRTNGFHGWLMYRDFLDLNLETPTKIHKDFGKEK